MVFQATGITKVPRHMEQLTRGTTPGSNRTTQCYSISPVPMYMETSIYGGITEALLCIGEAYDSTIASIP